MMGTRSSGDAGENEPDATVRRRAAAFRLAAVLGGLALAGVAWHAVCGVDRTDVPGGVRRATARVVVENADHDAGTVGFGVREPIFARFVLRNSGAAPVELGGVQTNCGCTDVTAPPEIAGRGAVEIVAEIDPTGDVGDHAVQIRVRTDDPAAAAIDLTCHWRIVEPLVVEPRQLEFDVRPGAAGLPQTVTVAMAPGLRWSEDVLPLRVREIETYPNGLTVRPVEPAGDADADTRLSLEVAVPPDLARETGSGFFRVWLANIDEDVAVPVLWTTPTALRSSRSRIVFTDARPGQTLRASLTVSADGPLEIVGVAAGDPALRAARAAGDRAADRADIALALEAPAASGLFESELRISARVRGGAAESATETLVVPVTAFIRE